MAYLSKSLCSKNQDLSTYEKECLAILMAVEKWRSYLQNQEFVIRTDHKSLLYLTDQRVHTKVPQKALLKLMDLKFKIVYKKGITNAAADALSRCPPISPILAISSCSPAWIEKLVQGYEDDSVAQQLLTELAIASPNSNGYSLVDGVIRHKGRVWLGTNSLAQQHVLEALHNSGIGDHSSFHGTYHRVKSLFSWPKMKDTVKQFIQQCEVCQQAKFEHVKSPRLFQPLPMPSVPWTVISMDFIEGLPSSNRMNTILVVVDKFTKYAHFIALSHPFTALQVAQLFMQNIYKLHGLPESIISDRDKIFTSKVWQELFRLSDTKLLMSSSYHPQTDGQTECLNQCLEAFLRCTVHSCPHQWYKWLPLAEFWYNTSFQSALGHTPFQVLYGHAPRHFGIASPDAVSLPDLDAWLSDRAMLSNLIQQQLVRAQQRMKAQADQHRSEWEFKVGDSVYLKLQPYIQTSVASQSNQKLSFKYFGPFLVLQHVGLVAYKLGLPADCRIHSVVYVSQLKAHVPPSTPVHSELPSTLVDAPVEAQPVAFLDHRLVHSAALPKSQLLVHWDVLPASLATWEEVQDLCHHFLAAPA